MPGIAASRETGSPDKPGAFQLAMPVVRSQGPLYDMAEPP